MGAPMKVFCGIDWASDHHDVSVVDGDGQLLSRARIADDAAGLQRLLGLLAEHGDIPGEQIPVAIETSRGLLVACLRATGRPVCAVNPMAAARYRERHTVSRKKPDHLDAMAPMPTPTAGCRPTANSPRPSPSWPASSRTPSGTAPRPATSSAPTCGEYFPGSLATVQPITGGVNTPLARTLLAAAPTPEQAARLTRTQLRASSIVPAASAASTPRSSALHAALRVTQLRQHPLVEKAMGRQTLALLAKFEAACTTADDLAEASVGLAASPTPRRLRPIPTARCSVNRAPARLRPRTRGDSLTNLPQQRGCTDP
ncbi:transposase [Kitasatospora herbaricolor]|uniref:IS110 family transposase n=1 Tax=Kitasatospora herbaricolor TaxID=68217 RepID=UPI0036DAF456